jgi:hypothetical protein
VIDYIKPLTKHLEYSEYFFDKKPIIFEFVNNPPLLRPFMGDSYSLIFYRIIRNIYLIPQIIFFLNIHKAVHPSIIIE